MAPVGKLWGYSVQRQTKIILAAAAVAGVEIETPPFEFGVTNRSPEFLAKFPVGKIPAFEDASGFTLVEGEAIARHLCFSLAPPECGLLGNDARERALVDQWMHFAESELALFSLHIKALHSGRLGPHTKEFFDGIAERQVRILQVLDQHLARCTSGFLVGNRMTLADIALAAATELAGKTTCGAAERGMYRNIFAHYDKIVSDSRVKAAFGEPEFLEEAMVYKEN